MTTLYYHKTDGGAEYLCTSPVEGTDEGDMRTAIVRLDGEPELINAVYEAAPDLLEALKAALKELEYLNSDSVSITENINREYISPDPEAIYNAQTAIAKAEGNN